ncbi:MAG: monothiol glutaredoxin, Grx4 family [Spirochaetales bacterium]|jgi:monothiol glutaredoxin|nr:monothiol glutaredoxin, Grx4 family [Spirochaetales bacterium]|tara:strand:+ start:3292 stop:3603 length:312 start_codon:yes stop_codon:yes gene_type:complete
MSDNIKEEISRMISENRVVLFMKGNPDMPMCGFSSRVVDILNKLEVRYQSYDVLSDPKLRSGIKEFSNWPTLPQLYIDGEFVGGCDICVEMFENGELAKKLDN